jgi:hypothetical protein
MVSIFMWVLNRSTEYRVTSLFSPLARQSRIQEARQGTQAGRDGGVCRRGGRSDGGQYRRCSYGRRIAAGSGGFSSSGRIGGSWRR